jgi:hypothetical protein
MGVSLAKISPVRQTNSPVVPNRSFQFHRSRQLFIPACDETSSIAMRVGGSRLFAIG